MCICCDENIVSNVKHVKETTYQHLKIIDVGYIMADVYTNHLVNLTFFEVYPCYKIIFVVFCCYISQKI